MHINDETGVILTDDNYTPRVRTKFNYDRDRASRDSGLYTDPDDNDGKTQQNFKEECDINNIVESFLKTGQMPEDVRLPQYIDYEGVFDFQTAMQTMMDAEANFMKIPAQIRSEFDNDPQQFLQFASDPANVDALIKYGLMREDYKKPEPPAPPAPPPGPGGTSTPT